MVHTGSICQYPPSRRTSAGHRVAPCITIMPVAPIPQPLPLQAMHYPHLFGSKSRKMRLDERRWPRNSTRWAQHSARWPHLLREAYLGRSRELASPRHLWTHASAWPLDDLWVMYRPPGGRGVTTGKSVAQERSLTTETVPFTRNSSKLAPHPPWRGRGPGGGGARATADTPPVHHDRGKVGIDTAPDRCIVEGLRSDSNS